MTDDDDFSLLPELSRTVPARLSEPTTVRGQRELTAYICASQLEQTLKHARARMTVALAVAEGASKETLASAILASWNASLADLNLIFVTTNLHGRTMVQAIKVLLAPE